MNFVSFFYHKFLAELLWHQLVLLLNINHLNYQSIMDYNISFRKSLLHQSPDPDSVDSSDTRGIHIGRAVTNLKNMGLDIVEVGVKHQVEIGLVANSSLFITSQMYCIFSQLLPPVKPLRLIGKADNLQLHRLGLQGNFLWRKRPSCSLSLEKQQ